MYRLITQLIIALSFVILSPRPILAVTAPNFPSCLSPQGTLRVYYPDGTHGIVGSSSEYVGSDAVYEVSDTTLIQCFCSVDGEGIQTNWWQASSLTDDDVNILKSQGWFYVPNGSLWGLASSPYVAQNLRYSCLSKPSPTPTPSNTNTNSNNDSSTQSTTVSETGSVLGLAATGDNLILIVLAILSFVLIVVGYRQSRHEKN